MPNLPDYYRFVRTERGGIWHIVGGTVGPAGFRTPSAVITLCDLFADYVGPIRKQPQGDRCEQCVAEAVAEAGDSAE